MLLYFRTHDNQVMPAGGGDAWFDKVPLRFHGYTDAQFREGGFRVVPPATVRTGAFIGRNVVLMPSYVNIGAYVDEGTMVDTWATVGSCAQIGKNVHLSGGVGIGGVLEPLQANPTIIEDNCFIGARSEIVEGVIVEAHSVISMGVFIGQSTKIYDRATGEVHYGRVPVGIGRRARQPAVGRRQVLAGVRGDRQARRRRDAREDVDQRAAPGLTDVERRGRIGSGHPSADAGAGEAADRLPVDHAGRRRLPRPDRGAAGAGRASRASGSIAAPCGTCGRGAAAARRSSASPATWTSCRRGRSSAGRAIRSRRPSATASCSGAAPPT